MKHFKIRSRIPEDCSDSDEEIQEAYARGDLKHGLNIEFDRKKIVYNIPQLLLKLDAIKLKLPWVERLDIVNDVAPLAPELVVQLEKQEQKRANLFKGNTKIRYISPEQDPILNDFKREMNFHRQAQSAIEEGIKKLHSLGIPTKRPEDYFAEMAKTDEHMQKVRSHLFAKQEGQAKSERIRQIREQRKMGKLLQKQTKVQREIEKKEMLDQLKKFRKGKLKNLDFLEDSKPSASNTKKQRLKNKKFGFGGKKCGIKRNTKESSMIDSRDFRNSNTIRSKRLGKSRRKQIKSKRSR